MGGAIDADPDELTALAARDGHDFRLDSVLELLDRFGCRSASRSPAAGLLDEA